ncbi:MAG: helix-turn-helix transcriptional regulator [Tepidiformaceae bacterium]
MADGSDFGSLLREFRLRSGHTQPQLAQNSGLSASTIQSYEIGRRLPEAAAVEKLRKVLGLNNGDHARLRVAAALDPPETGLQAAWLKARGAPNTVWDEVQAADWSSLVINERREIVAWNRLANRVGEKDLVTLSQFQRSILRMAATEHFDRHLTNWMELIGRLISQFKEEVGDLSQGPPPLFLQAVIENIGAEDPRFLPAIFDLFVKVTPWRAEARNVHPIKWKLDDGTELAFHGSFGDWSQYDGLWSFDWHAADAATARWVQAELATGATDVTPPETNAFEDEIARVRADARLSRAELARRSGISVAAITAYERGRRSPSRNALVALCRALTMDGYTTNRLLREASFDEEPSDWARWMSGETPISVYEGKGSLHATSGPAIFREVDFLDWPCVVLDASCHVVHANPHAGRLVDMARWRPLPGRPGPHLMQLMVSQQFREQVANWTTVAGVVLPGRLEAQVLGNPGDTSAGGVRAVAEHLRKTEADGLGQLFDVWSNSPGFSSLRRPAVRFEWRTEEGEDLVFNCVFGTWNAYDPYKVMDLFPADEATFGWLERG